MRNTSSSRPSTSECAPSRSWWPIANASIPALRRAASCSSSAVHAPVVARSSGVLPSFVLMHASAAPVQKQPHDFEVPPLAGAVQRSVAVSCLCVNLCALVQEQLHDGGCSARGCAMKRRVPMVCLGIDICVLVQQQLHDRLVHLLGCAEQRRVAVDRRGVHVCAPIKEQLH
eukprot:CAMPEP_0180349186 /NCGR_PEP_ID=MMETSP0989-20121125/5330_1 /TAXON_ID=697907 /ORGANISM="non described non described, Strain CCMP2293" /LENGTH=171 /DNA_ID=CAMNT_0022338483 /DNA_START=362 /DNA_END=876 /DNA_ORIENTATION=-